MCTDKMSQKPSSECGRSVLWFRTQTFESEVKMWSFKFPSAGTLLKHVSHGVSKTCLKEKSRARPRSPPSPETTCVCTKLRFERNEDNLSKTSVVLFSSLFISGVASARVCNVNGDKAGDCRLSLNSSSSLASATWRHSHQEPHASLFTSSFGGA